MQNSTTTSGKNPSQSRRTLCSLCITKRHQKAPKISQQSHGHQVKSQNPLSTASSPLSICSSALHPSKPHSFRGPPGWESEVVLPRTLSCPFSSTPQNPNPSFPSSESWLSPRKVVTTRTLLVMSFSGGSSLGKIETSVLGFQKQKRSVLTHPHHSCA